MIKSTGVAAKSYCRSSNLLGTSCLGAATICTSESSLVIEFYMICLDTVNLFFKCLPHTSLKKYRGQSSKTLTETCFGCFGKYLQPLYTGRQRVAHRKKIPPSCQQLGCKQGIPIWREWWGFPPHQGLPPIPNILSPPP